ncbi:F-box domain-containing protein [Apiospora saccharicola]|uniref:F-box domain-containing protein n=1 Tax=Apiospora saccharicola TaxID=335842 RepID=A0ABR1VEA1_9PEZI
MPPQKRKLFPTAEARHNENENENDIPTIPHAKRPRLATAPRRRDHLSPLSDELLVRILTCLPLPSLLNVAPVSRRFHRLADDSQLWKRLYYSRFVLPRALRIPGFRNGSAREGKLHYSSRRTIWADGRRGGWVDMSSSNNEKNDVGDGVDRPLSSRDWKGQYKLRHNWSKGKAAVEELHVGDSTPVARTEEEDDEVTTTSRPMLVKISEGVAVTADLSSGLRVWDLRTKELVAQITLLESESSSPVVPSCLAIDDQELHSRVLNVAVGFGDGSFGVWKLNIGKNELIRMYQHEKSTNGELVGIAYSHPYLLTATESVLISLYTFEVAGEGPNATLAQDRPTTKSINISLETQSQTEDEAGGNTAGPKKPQMGNAQSRLLQAPLLLTSLKSHTSRAPLALSIRKTASTTIASIAYTFSTLQGWSLGIQDLHLRASSSRTKATPDITTTRIAYSPSIRSSPSQVLSPPSSPARPTTASRANASSRDADDGPTNICYNHPYLLATLPDNTLILHLCTSNATSLSVSPGIRLWGHTSGISDAEITSRGKAVSVSCRGEEIRVWELEGRAEARSIEVRPNVPTKSDTEADSSSTLVTFDEKRNWVGFDDEMVIVLKESSQGRESLMVYDFT